jgi:hypothetical protein
MKEADAWGCLSEQIKQELSTYTSFSLPEHYFRISRKEQHGRFYSKIEKVEWEGVL